MKENVVLAQGVKKGEKLLSFLSSIGFVLVFDLQKILQIQERIALKLNSVNKNSILHIDEYVKALYEKVFGRISSYFQAIDKYGDMYTSDRSSLNQENINNTIDVLVASMGITANGMWWKKVLNYILYTNVLKVILNNYIAEEKCNEEYGNINISKVSMFGYNIFVDTAFPKDNSISLWEWMKTDEKDEIFSAKFNAAATSYVEQIGLKVEKIENYSQKTVEEEVKKFLERTKS